MLDLEQVFGNDNPVIMEIGFGNGELLAEHASRYPNKNFIGIEVHKPGVGHLLLKLQEQGSENVRVIRHDAIEVLQQQIATSSLAGINLFFPDPWHKKRHNKRRIVQADFLKLIASRLRPGGIFHTATDWEDYAQHMMRVLTAASDYFENCAGTGHYTPRPEDRPLTKFEQRGQKLGHGVWDLKFWKI